MATMNFSIPDEIKQAFNREFAGRNKSAIVSELMQQAIGNAQRQRERETAFRLLTRERTGRRPLTDDQIRQARESDRP